MLLRESYGVYFESVVLEHLESIEGFEHSTRKDDVYKGTDFFYYGLPIDLTLREGKDNSIHISYLSLDDNCDIKLSLRFGNGVVRFKQPTLVIHVMSDIKPELFGFLLDKEVLEYVTGLYWDSLDSFESQKAL